MMMQNEAMKERLVELLAGVSEKGDFVLVSIINDTFSYSERVCIDNVTYKRDLSWLKVTGDNDLSIIMEVGDVEQIAEPDFEEWIVKCKNGNMIVFTIL